MTIGCDEAKRWMDAWLDGELDPSAALHVETHMARCCDCRAESEGIKQLKRALAGMREECAPTALRFRLSAALDAVDHEAEVAAAGQRRRRHAISFALTGAALAGVVLTQGLRVRGTSVGGGDYQGAALLPVVEDVAQRHARELPVEVTASDPSAVSQWFRGKLDIPVHPVMFRGMTARLVGARISNVRNQEAAALYYDVGGHHMTVFVFDSALMPGMTEGARTAVVDGRPYYVTSAHGYTVTLTEQQGVGYAIASDLPPQECARIVAHAELQ